MHETMPPGSFKKKTGESRTPHNLSNPLQRAHRRRPSSPTVRLFEHGIYHKPNPTEPVPTREDHTAFP